MSYSKSMPHTGIRCFLYTAYKTSVISEKLIQAQQKIYVSYSNYTLKCKFCIHLAT